ALYYLVLGQAQQAQHWYRQALALHAGSELIWMSSRDLEDLLVLLPETTWTQRLRGWIRKLAPRLQAAAQSAA
ncbi:MAG: hypothetical protein AAGF24_09655, partial [Cyanobacteria bacterium P01_H01_bin.121]